MTLWIAWSVLMCALIALSAAAVDRAAALFAARRRFVWLGAMVCAVVVPLVAAVPHTPKLSGTLHQSAVAPQSVSVATDASDALAMSEAPLIPPVAATPQATRPVPAWDHAIADIPQLARAMDPWIVRAWIAASTLLILILVGAMLRLRRKSARWHDAEVGPCRALVAPDAGPAVIGFARPRIVIPTWVLSLDQAAQALLLRHEMEHIDAGDPRMLLAAGALLVALPWNAPLWWMLGRLRLAIEIDCDARVVRALGTAHDYGMVLLAVGARRIVPLPFAAPLTEGRPSLERRITAMTTPRARRPLLASLPFVAIALMAMTAATRAPRPEPFRARAVALRTDSAEAGVASDSVVEAVAAPPLSVPVPQKDSVQTAQPRGELQLDSLLGQGRSRPGLRVDSSRLRPYFDGIIGNPFVPMLVLASDLQLSTSQRDSVVADLTRFERRSDSAWTKVVVYLAQQPDNYDIDAAWSLLLGAADTVIKGMLTDGAALKGTLLPAQLAELPLGLRGFLEPGCATFFHQRVESGVHSVPRTTSVALVGAPFGRGAAGSTALRVCAAAH